MIKSWCCPVDSLVAAWVTVLSQEKIYTTPAASHRSSSHTACQFRSVRSPAVLPCSVRFSDASAAINLFRKVCSSRVCLNRRPSVAATQQLQVLTCSTAVGCCSSSTFTYSQEAASNFACSQLPIHAWCFCGSSRRRRQSSSSQVCFQGGRHRACSAVLLQQMRLQHRRCLAELPRRTPEIRHDQA